MILDPKYPIVGAKGGGGKGGKGGGGGGGEEADNTLRSKAVAQVVELLSEGEIVGLVDGAKSIYFDQTALQNENGSYNFKGVEFEQRFGLPDQPHITGVPQVETPYTVEVQLKKSEGPLIRTILEQNADAVRVVVRLPSLARQDKKNGNIEPTDLSYAIDLRPYNGTWTTVHTTNLRKQKCTSAYQRAHHIELPAGGAPWDIRLRRITNDSDKVELQNETWWESYSVIVEGKFTYPNSALVYLKIDAQQFGQNIPSRFFRVKGLKINVPTNYNPETREYDGLWDGTFKVAWTDNPAWIFFDLITNDRYGLGEFVDVSKVDKWGLYQIAQYCDQLVSTGFKDDNGNDLTEPRYTYNGVINNRDEAYRVLQQITTAFRGMAYWSVGQVFAVVDAPIDATKLVAPADVIDGHFNYSGTAMKARHSVALVTWNDPSDMFRPAIEVVINDEMLQRYGWREIEVDASGCTSRTRAHRYGRWILDTEQHETETVSYSASYDHARVVPGNVIALADPRKAAVRTGGRIRSAVGSAVNLDYKFEPTPDETYQLSAELPNGTVETRNIVEFAQGEEFTSLTLESGFSEDPIVNAMWVIQGTDVQPRLYRVLGIAEDEKNIFKITALFHDPTKYARIESNIKLDPIPYTRPTNYISSPTNVSAQESLYFQNGITQSAITVSWTHSEDFMAVGYNVSADTPNGFVNYGQVTNVSTTITNTIGGDYVFYVTAVSASGLQSPAATVEFSALGWEGLDPPYVSHLEIFNRGQETTFGGTDCRITWRNNFPGTTYDYGSEPNGASSTDNNPFYLNNIIRVYDALTNDLLRQEIVIGETYNYRYESNSEDNEVYSRGASRMLRFEVAIRDTIGRESAIAKLTANNPVPDLVIPQVYSGIDSLFVQYVAPNDLDYAGALIWISENPAFNPLSITPIYDGPNNFASFPAEGLKTYYVRLAVYDSFGKNGLNISPVVAVTTKGIDIVGDPPAVPTGLTLSNLIQTMPSGEVFVKLVAEWDTNPSDNFSYFDVGLKTDTSDYINSSTSSNRYEWVVTPDTHYTVHVRAVSVLGNPSIYAPEVSVMSGSKTTDPLAPSALTATSSLKSAYLHWVNSSDPDIDVIEVWMNVVDNRGTATRVGTTRGSAFTHSGLTTDQTYYYWVRAKSTSGRFSAYNATQGLAVTPGQVAEGDIAANAITADKIQAGTITGDKLKIDTNLPATIKVGETEVTIGELGDPAAAINSNETLIEPGKVTISGDITLADWRSGTDQTKISGGSIAANTIDANKLTVGMRALTFADLQFSYDKTTNTLSWSSGSVAYANDAGVAQIDAINAGSVVWTSGTLYVAWRRGLTTLVSNITPYVGADYVILATYRGDNNLVATYGRTIIDGANIVANSITGDSIRAGTIQATSIAANTITGNEIAGETITGEKLIIGAVDSTRIEDGAVTTDKIFANAITTDKLAASSVTAENLAADSVTADALAAGAVTAESIAVGAVTADAIAAGAITADNIQVNAITAEKLTLGGVTTEKLEQQAVTATAVSSTQAALTPSSARSLLQTIVYEKTNASSILVIQGQMYAGGRHISSASISTPARDFQIRRDGVVLLTCASGMYSSVRTVTHTSNLGGNSGVDHTTTESDSYMGGEWMTAILCEDNLPVGTYVYELWGRNVVFGYNTGVSNRILLMQEFKR